MCAPKWSPARAPVRFPSISVSRLAANSVGSRPITSDDSAPFTVVTSRKMSAVCATPGVVPDPRLERHGQQRLRRVLDAALEQPEIGAADVDEVAGGSLRARRDREQGDDEADPEGDAGRRQERADGPSQEVFRTKPNQVTGPIFATVQADARRDPQSPRAGHRPGAAAAGHRARHGSRRRDLRRHRLAHDRAHDCRLPAPPELQQQVEQALAGMPGVRGVALSFGVMTPRSARR